MAADSRRATSSQTSVVTRIRELRGMTVGQLRETWVELFGEEARTRNKEYLFRRLAWRVQEMAYGGLSDRAKVRAIELAEGVSIRVRPPRGFDPATVMATKPKRDPRLPKAGTVLVRQYRGEEIRVTVLDRGFEWDGRTFDSLTAVTFSITKTHWSGRLFFGLTSRRRAR
jgi:hypothetical protein